MRLMQPCNQLPRLAKRQSGFTLVEAVVVIVLTGIIAGVVAIFIQKPIEGYFDAARRAELTDVADTAVRRFGRDVRLALPNSVRITNGGHTIEFLMTSAGGRYRAEASGAAGEDILDFAANDTSFDVIGPAMTFDAATSNKQNQIVIYNLGIPGADAYVGNSAASHNRRNYNGATGVGVTNIVISSVNPFPLESPGRTFQVVDTPVTYRCDLTAGVNTLTRYSGYTITAVQPDPPASGAALLATDVSDCIFTYAPGVTERSALVSMRLSVSKSGETVTLYHEVHVSNVP